MTVHLAPGSDGRRVIDAVRSTYSGARMVKRRQTTRETPSNRLEHVLTERPDRPPANRPRSGSHAGFFEWPRAASGEEIAEALGVASPTFHRHLRKAEQKVFDSLLSGSGTS